MKIRETEFKCDTSFDLSETLLKEINMGISDLEAGRVMSHKEAIKQIREELGLDKI